MWYIFNAEKCIASSDFLPNCEDLATRNEWAIESSENISIHEVELFEQTIKRKPKKLPVLEDLKQVKRQQINAERDRIEQSGFLFNGYLLDSDIHSIQRIAVAAQAAQWAINTGQVNAVNWTCADNSVITLTAAEVITIPSVLAQHSANLHHIARQLKDQVDAAQTIDQLNNIVWPNDANE